jgi:integrase
MVDTVQGTLTAARGRALILIGFAGGLRRSELAGICFDHLQWHSSGRGITITLPKSKTDRERQGREVEIARGSQPENTPLSEFTCPIRALEQWLRQANIRSGPVFRRVSRGENVQKAVLNPASVAWILQRALGRAGVRDLHRYGAHSLRAGFATTAFDNGAPEFKIRRQTGHKTSRMLEKYIRPNRRRDRKRLRAWGFRGCTRTCTRVESTLSRRRRHLTKRKFNLCVFAGNHGNVFTDFRSPDIARFFG